MQRNRTGTSRYLRIFATRYEKATRVRIERKARYHFRSPSSFPIRIVAPAPGEGDSDIGRAAHVAGRSAQRDDGARGRPNDDAGSAATGDDGFQSLRDNADRVPNTRYTRP